MTRRGVIFDLVAAQSPSYRGRGIARYSTELVRAMVQYHPELVSSIVVHPELGPIDGTDDLAEWLTTSPDWAEGSVLHMGSVIEPEVPVRVYWPREASAHRLYTAVTLYDLIPELFPGWYLQDPGLRRRWRCCLEVVRQADAILTLSASTKQDTIGLLGVPEERVTVVGGGTSPVFRRPESRKEAFKVARKGVKGLKEGFLVYNGAFNPRKNVDGLVRGYASLPSELVKRHQLVIVCEAPPLTRNHYLVMAKELGVEGRVLIPGFVPEEVLVALFQSTELAVYPSLYEGYGLPVIDSLACGAPTIAGDNSSLREILPREARFEPTDPGAIAAAIVRALTDKPFRERLTALTNMEPPSWASVADRAAVVFEELLRRSLRYRPAWRTRPQLALIGVPAKLAAALEPLASLDQFGGVTEIPGEEPSLGPSQCLEDAGQPISYAALRSLDRWRGGYDAVVTWVPGQPSALGTAPPSTVAPFLGGIERLARAWPGRTVALVDEKLDGAEGTFSEPPTALRLEGAGMTVVPVSEATSWDDIARRVAGTTRDTAV
ncbi:MAG TPA: glycosyltransferase family 1 protein [Acidimicrobiales bacterium]|nr:glycosyltransferase family 1 protein [Acidimicrobiales bacterium]